MVTESGCRSENELFLLATVGSDFGTCTLMIVQCHVKNCSFVLNVSNVTGDHTCHMVLSVRCGCHVGGDNVVS